MPRVYLMKFPDKLKKELRRITKAILNGIFKRISKRYSESISKVTDRKKCITDAFPNEFQRELSK